MTRLPTFAPSTPSTPSTAPRRAAAKKTKCVKPDAKSNTARSTRSAQRDATAAHIRATPAATFAALEGNGATGVQAEAIRDAFATYATQHQLTGHWRLHWNAYLASHMQSATPLEVLRHHVSGAIERGEAEPIVGIPADPSPYSPSLHHLGV